MIGSDSLIIYPSKFLPDEKSVVELWNYYTQLLQERGAVEIKTIRSFLEEELARMKSEVAMTQEAVTVLEEQLSHAPSEDEEAIIDAHKSDTYFIEQYYPKVISRIETRLYVLNLLLRRHCVFEEDAIMYSGLDKKQKEALHKGLSPEWDYTDQFKSKRSYEHFQTGYRVVKSHPTIPGKKGIETQSAVIAKIAEEANVHESTIRETAHKNEWHGHNLRSSILKKAEYVPESIRSEWIKKG